MPDLSDQIEELAGLPKKIDVDGQLVEEQSIKDLIEADRYLQERTAASRSTLPIRFQRLNPPGAV